MHLLDLLSETYRSIAAKTSINITINNVKIKLTFEIECDTYVKNE